MKNILFTIIIAIAAMIVSCGPNKDEQKEKALADSIKKADSVSNLFIGTWKAEGQNISITIVKAGDLFTITTGTGSVSAYKLNGQLLNSVDGAGATYSLIGADELLQGTSKFIKVTDESSDRITETEITKKNTSASEPATTTAATTSTTTTTTTSSLPKELTIVSENTVNIRQSPLATSPVIRGATNGTVCKLLEKGKQATIGGKTDFWYKVSVEGDKGWIFGSYTSLRQQ